MENKNIKRRSFIKGAMISAAGLGLASTSNLSTPAFAAGKIPHRKFGSTGDSLPILHLGTAQSMDTTYDKIMHRCFKEGVYWIDTAISYGWGSSHKAIANFMSQIGNRKKLWITSKSGAWTANGFKEDADKCLRQLKTDYLDLYLIHGISGPGDLSQDYLKVADSLKKSGKTRFFGYSIHSGDVVGSMKKAVQVGGIDAIMFRYNFRRYGDRELNKAIDDCKRAGIGLIAMKTMGGVSSDEESVVKFRSKNFSLAQAKLKSVWEDERIDTIVSEMQNVQQVVENATAARTATKLSASEFHQLNQLAAYTDHLACNGCSHICESAIRGNTRIADQLRFLMYYENYGDPKRAKSNYQSLAATHRAFEHEDLRRASERCPQKINITARLQKAKELLA